MGDYTQTLPRRPGLMIVGPRLHDPNPFNTATFLRWTKLHFRDLLSMPTDPALGRLTRTLRFTAPEGDDKYSHADGQGLCKYTYSCIVDDIGILQTQMYYGVSRALNLERTRSLGMEEEGVGSEKEDAMVWDIVSAKFAVFVEVLGGDFGDSVGSYQDLPVSLTSPAGSKPTAPHSCFVGMPVTLTGGDTKRTAIIRELQASLVQKFAAAPKALSLYTSLYQYAGLEAQPDGHPTSQDAQNAGWFIVLLVVDEGGVALKREHVVDMVGKWVAEKTEEGIAIMYGVWNGEIFMS